MKLPRYNNSARFEAALETFGVPPKNPVARGGGLSDESSTKFGTRLENVHARRNGASSLRPTSRRDRAYELLGCRVTSMKRRTKIVAAFFVRSSVYAPWPLPLLAFTPRGLVDGRAARLRSRRSGGR